MLSMFDHVALDTADVVNWLSRVQETDLNDLARGTARRP